jgi:hypothetical protein
MKIKMSQNAPWEEDMAAYLHAKTSTKVQHPHSTTPVTNVEGATQHTSGNNLCF